VTIYFEDFVVGHAFEFGDVVMTEEEIIEFATRYDPQPFHVDPEAAKETVFGGLIASGWLTCSLFMRMLVDGLINDSSGQGSPGMDEVRWLAPVRPGDRLTARSTVMKATPSSKNPARGTVVLHNEMTNQDGIVVMSMSGVRPATGPARLGLTRGVAASRCAKQLSL
jgi:acyl dehydratase